MKTYVQSCVVIVHTLVLLVVHEAAATVDSYTTFVSKPFTGATNNVDARGIRATPGGDAAPCRPHPLP